MTVLTLLYRFAHSLINLYTGLIVMYRIPYSWQRGIVLSKQNLPSYHSHMSHQFSYCTGYINIMDEEGSSTNTVGIIAHLPQKCTCSWMHA